MTTNMPSSRPAKPASPYHHGDLREALIRAAQTEIERAGAETISLAAIAKSLGVSQAAPYRHFADRDALLGAVATKGFQAFKDAITDAVAAASPVPALTRIAQAYVAFGLEHRGLYRLMFASHVLANAPGDSELSIAAFEGFGLLLDALEPSDEPYARMRKALRIWAGLHGMVMLAQQGMLTGRAANMTLAELAADVVA
jgi:AcrR family transcriptional regulator